MEDPVFAFPRSPGPDLKGAMRRARVEEAERSSASAELRGAEAARLEMLRDALEPVFAQLPQGADMFDLGLVPGQKPRLFVDMVAYVEMDRDRRTFRFVQDTRSGRFVLAESDRLDPMTEAVTAYLGRRLVERERALAGDIRGPQPLGAVRGDALAATEGVRTISGASPADDEGHERPRRFSGGDVAFALLVGIILGVALLFLASWLKARGMLAGLPLPLG